MFPKIGVGPQNGWFIMENFFFKWMIWGENPLFSETSIYDIWNPNDPIGPRPLEFGVSAIWPWRVPNRSQGWRATPMGDRCIMAGGGPPFCHPNLGVARWLASYLLLTIGIYVYIVYTSSWWFFFPSRKI